MTDRRYSDDEVAAIFSRAVEGSPPSVQASRDEGLTLVELQQIGREVGIAPDAVARAAKSLAVAAPKAPRRFFGMPIRVERTVVLDRWMSDAEWERLVVQLRDVFDARGTVSGHGNFRQWTNGNLQALLEPTSTGHRLRLRTTRAAARARMSVGAAMSAMGTVVAISAAAGGHLAASVPGALTLILAGAGMAAFGALPLPKWARLRGRQMDEIATSVSAGPDEEPPERIP